MEGAQRVGDGTVAAEKRARKVEKKVSAAYRAGERAAVGWSGTDTGGGTRHTSSLPGTDTLDSIEAARVRRAREKGERRAGRAMARKVQNQLNGDDGVASVLSDVGSGGPPCCADTLLAAGSMVEGVVTYVVALILF